MQLPDKSPRSENPPPQAPQKNITPVVPPGAVKAKRPATKRFFDFVFAESAGALVRRIGTEVLMPRAKAGVEEALNSFIHGMFWGNGPSPMSNVVRGAVLRGSAQVYHNAQNMPSGLQQAQQQRQVSTGNYQDIAFPTQQHAQTVLSNLYAVFNQYSVVSVADLYEMANIEPSTSDNAYGWLSLDAARISQDNRGFVLELPRPSIIT